MFVVLVRQDLSIAASAVGQLLMTQPKAATVGAARILTPPQVLFPRPRSTLALQLAHIHLTL